jgi:hypothetical protein
MTPHIHQVSSSKSTAGRGGQAIKTEDTEKAITLFTGMGSDADSVRVHLDSHIHVEDIVQFVQFGFDERVKRLATRSGFQAAIIRDVYKHVSNFKQTERIVKAMHTAAMDRAKTEIEGQEIEDLYASNESEPEDDESRD